MRQRFNPEPDFPITPIEKILLPLKSRDELPPILAALQWIWMQATLKTEILALLEARIVGGQEGDRTHRHGLVADSGTGRGPLGVGRGLGSHGTPGQLRLAPAPDAGCVLSPMGTKAHRFVHQTLRDNVALVDAALLKQINVLVAAAGRQVFVSKPSAGPAPLQIKVDTYVLETDVHFPPT